METLPQIAVRAGAPLDSLRRQVRENSELAALGCWIGASRAYRPDEAQLIVKAWQERRRKRGAAPAATAM